MKRCASLLATLAVVAAPAFASRVSAADQTLSGTISDSLCAAKHTMTEHGKNLSDRDCTQACSGHGAQYVLLVNDKVYKLRSHESELRTHAGHAVQVTGDVSGDTIKVSKVEMPKS